ncbi:MAG: HAMP domain-containing sensor histidine kinase [Deltaproteobacteria bacterium]|nr:HAMP domain-containing sensor histidine kinase [Deltaproteobacteria bacterium]
MPSASKRSLHGRVAWITALSAAIAALVTTLLLGALSANLALRQEDRRIQDILTSLAVELSEEPPSAARLAHVTEDEQREVRHSGVQLSAFFLGVRVSGVGTWAGSEGCRTVDRTALTRQCALRVQDQVLLAQSTLTTLADFRRVVTLAGAVSLLLVTALAVLLSRFVARAAIGPLQTLRESVASVRIDDPDPSVLAAPQAYLELQALQDALVLLIRSLGESLSQARRFAFNAAHELRTPLATLRAEAELAGDATENPAMDRVAGLAAELARRLDRALILADLREVQGGEPVALDAVAQDVVRALDPVEAARVTVATEHEGLVHGDPALLQMLVRNATENALKFSRGPVQITIAEDPAQVSVTITDEGEGMTAQEQSRAFEPFFRGEFAKRNHVAGSGLGLALIAHIARAHRGTARFEPRTRGTSLCVTLPAWRAPSPH